LKSLGEAESERSALLGKRTPEDPDVQNLTARITELQSQLRDFAATYLQGLSNQVGSLDAVLARSSADLRAVPAKEIEYARLARQSKVLEDIFTLLQTRLKEAQIAAAVEDPSVRVIDPAVPPLKPIRPRMAFNLAAALVLGLIMGFGVAFGREHMDDTIHTREELQALTSGAPVLGLIPNIDEVLAQNAPSRTVFNRMTQQTVPLDDSPAGHFARRLVTNRDPRSPISEAFRSLRTNITFSRSDRTPKVLVFTSPTPGDGKSTTAANLAVTLAQQDLRTLLIDADMRRGALHTTFGAAREPGLSNLLLGRATLDETITHATVGASSTIDFMATGTMPPNPAELLGSPRMRALLETLDSRYDAIIIDAPPLNLVTDAAILGTSADGVLMVARAGITERRALMFALDQLSAVHAPLIGAVLNDIDWKKERFYGSYGSASRYYYASSSTSGK
jgi:tyrosine-protein kinase Etk/Wzc